MTKILGLSGSLRAASHNSTLLHAARQLAPAGIVFEVFTDLGALPLFNVDLEDDAPQPVARLHAALVAADAVVIASPEYAHGVSGVMKNALDWMVGNESFVHKPVALFNASPRATLAEAALRETLTTMSAIVVEEACIAVPLLGTRFDAPAIERDTGMARSIVTALERLRDAAAGRVTHGGWAPVP